MAGKDVKVSIGAEIGGFNEKMAQIREGLRGFAELAGAIAAALPIDKIKGLTESMAALGVKTEAVAARLHVPTEDVAALGFVAKSGGADLDALASAMTRLAYNLVNGSDQTKRALDALGLSISSFKELSPEKQLEILADRFSKATDGTAKNAIAVSLLGRAGADLIPVLNQGSAAIREWGEEAKRLGVALSAETVGQMLAMDDALTKMKAAYQGAGVQIFLEFRGALQGIVQEITDLVTAFTDAMRSANILHDAIAALGVAAEVLASGYVGVWAIIRSIFGLIEVVADESGAGFIGLATLIAGVVDGINSGIREFFAGLVDSAREGASAVGQQFADLGKVIFDALHGNISSAAADFDALKSDARSAASSIGASLAGSMKGFDFSGVSAKFSATMALMRQVAQTFAAGQVEDAKEAFAVLQTIWGEQAAAAAYAGKGINLNMQGTGANEALNAQVTALNSEIAHFKSVEQQKQALVEEEVKTKQISAQEGLHASLAALQEELAAAMSVYKREEGLLAGQPLKVAEILAKEKALQNDYAKSVQQLQFKAAEETQREWQRAFGKINSALESQIGGLLKGTQTWRQAMQKVLAQLTTDVIKFFVNWGLEQAENTALQVLNIGKVTAAQETGSEAQLAAQTASAAGGAAAALGHMLEILVTDAKAVFGGVFAFLAPIMGPAAAAPATAAAASVASGFYATGSWELPSDQLAMVHRGEMIVPAAHTPWAQSLMANAMGQGSGDHYHTHNWNISVNGARRASDVVGEIEDHVGEIARIFSRQFNLRQA